VGKDIPGEVYDGMIREDQGDEALILFETIIRNKRRGTGDLSRE
jgi:hypothetical protein